MATVYRIEDADNDGPYCGANACSHMFDRRRHNNNDTHAGYSQDKGLHTVIDDIEPYKFAFATKKQLKKWFDVGEREILDGFGFKVVKYKMKAKHRVKTKLQAVFLPDKAEEVGCISTLHV